MIKFLDINVLKEAFPKKILIEVKPGREWEEYLCEGDWRLGNRGEAYQAACILSAQEVIDIPLDLYDSNWGIRAIRPGKVFIASAFKLSEIYETLRARFFEYGVTSMEQVRTIGAWSFYADDGFLLRNGKHTGYLNDFINHINDSLKVKDLIKEKIDLLILDDISRFSDAVYIEDGRSLDTNFKILLEILSERIVGNPAIFCTKE